jgi:alkanesulfonate monooxygenase SsuD/methylene tetrahydromethanopterin reductase-like flavin-dependent oxidoreductase (luciferase family)
MTALDVCAPSLALADVAGDAAEFERRGVRGLWTAETVRSIAPILAETIRGTRHAAIGAGVYVAPLHHPLALASEILDLQELSGGRLVCGVGLRGPGLLTHQTGIRIPKPLEYMRDYVRALRAAMQGIADGRCAYRGDTFTVRFPPIAPIFGGPRTPPVLLAAVGPRMAALAADEADGWILHPVHEPGDLIATWHNLDLAGLRRRRAFSIVSYRLVWHDEWPIELLHGLKASIAFYGLAKSYRKHRERVGYTARERLTIARNIVNGDHAAAAATVPDGVWRRIVLHGSTEQIAAQMAVEAPYCDRLCLTLPWIGLDGATYAAGVRGMRALLDDLAAVAHRGSGMGVDPCG